MHSIKVNRGVMFYCPQCELRNYFLGVGAGDAELLQPADSVLDPDEAIPHADESHFCAFCHYELTTLEALPARPISDEGGCLLPLWWFMCDNCGRQVFLEKTLYFGGGRELPPRKFRCKHCGMPFKRRTSAS